MKTQPQGRGWLAAQPARMAVLLLTLFYALSGGLLAGFATWHDRGNVVEEVENSTQDLARLLEDHVRNALVATDLLLRRAADTAAVETNRAERWQAVEAALASSPHVLTLFMLDAEGRLVAGPAAKVPGDLAKRDFFTAAKDGAETTVGQVAKDWATGTYAFTVARRLAGPQGEFAGLVAANVSVPYFKTLYQGLHLGSDPGLGVYRLDGAILVREPLPESDIGRNMLGNPVYTKYLPQSPTGTYHGKSAYDGVVRIVSYRKVDNPALLVWVAVSLDDALDNWRERAWRNALLAIIGLVMTLGLAGLALGGINRERRAYGDLSRSNERLRQANADLERYAEISAHHLQEPLRVVSSYAQLLQGRLGDRLDGDSKEFLGFLVEAAKDMKLLLRDLQRYTALGLRNPAADPVVLANCAKAAITELNQPIQALAAQVELGEMPRVVGDAAQLKLVLKHLIDNGLAYRSPERPPEIAITAERVGAMWQIRVADNGIGIEAEYQERIFRIFERLHPKHLQSGTGIGLAIVKRIVERHGGRIWCESEPGRGSSFLFTLPAEAGA